MEHESLHVISLAVAGISGALLFWRGYRRDMLGHYPLVYAYIGVSLLSELLGEVALRHLGVQSPAYSLIYAGLSLVQAALGIAVLLRIYYLFRKPSLIADWHILGFLALILSRDFFWTASIWISYRALTASQMLRTYIGICALARLFTARAILGWNLSMALLAITLPPAFQSIILSQYLFGHDTFSYSSTLLWMELTTLASWTILVVGFWEHSPPARVQVPKGVAEKMVQARIWANIKALWGHR